MFRRTPNSRSRSTRASCIPIRSRHSRKVGVNRVSLGVQDFNEIVQRAIGRMQSYEATRQAVERFRAVGIGSVNIDLVYGLPHQTEDSVARTIEQVLTLDPGSHRDFRLCASAVTAEASAPDRRDRPARTCATFPAIAARSGNADRRPAIGRSGSIISRERATPCRSSRWRAISRATPPMPRTR